MEKAKILPKNNKASSVFTIKEIESDKIQPDNVGREELNINMTRLKKRKEIVKKEIEYLCIFK